ncbi:MAG: hypothetical protein AB7O38_06545 [Pirellulaceae bacterium]
MRDPVHSAGKVPQANPDRAELSVVPVGDISRIWQCLHRQPGKLLSHRVKLAITVHVDFWLIGEGARPLRDEHPLETSVPDRQSRAAVRCD